MREGPGPELLVLRPDPDGERLAALLRGLGYGAEARAPLTIEGLSPPAPAGSMDCIIFVSRHAVRFGLPCLENPMGVPVLAVGPATVRALADAGVHAEAPEDARTEGLLTLDALNIPPKRILLVRGQGGRTLLRDTLLQRGHEVQELVVYRRIAAPLDPIVASLRRKPAAVIITSGEIFEIFDRAWRQCHGDVKESPLLVVPSERIAENARTAGYTNPFVSNGASDGAIAAALKDAGLTPSS